MNLLEKVTKMKLVKLCGGKCEVCGKFTDKAELNFWALYGDHGKMDMSRDFEELVEDTDRHMLLCDSCHRAGHNL